MKILCIGDSNTYGYDPHTTLGGRYPPDLRWTDRLEYCDVVNAGVNGLTVPLNSWDYVGLIGSTAPDLVTVMLGGNDLLQGASAVQTACRMDGFLKGICKAGAPILLIAPPPMQLGAWVPHEELVRESELLPKLYQETALKNGVLFTDAGEWMVELTYDGVHFTPAGHAAFAEGLEKVLKEIG